MKTTTTICMLCISIWVNAQAGFNGVFETENAYQSLSATALFQKNITHNIVSFRLTNPYFLPNFSIADFGFSKRLHKPNANIGAGLLYSSLEQLKIIKAYLAVNKDLKAIKIGGQFKFGYLKQHPTESHSPISEFNLWSSYQKGHLNLAFLYSSKIKAINPSHPLQLTIACMYMISDHAKYYFDLVHNMQAGVNLITGFDLQIHPNWTIGGGISLNSFQAFISFCYTFRQQTKWRANLYYLNQVGSSYSIDGQHTFK